MQNLDAVQGAKQHCGTSSQAMMSKYRPQKKGLLPKCGLFTTSWDLKCQALCLKSRVDNLSLVQH